MHHTTDVQSWSNLHRRRLVRTAAFLLATVHGRTGPGVVVSPAADIRAALQNPATTVIDARTIEELQANGYILYRV
jgi:hypothetical protein